MYKVEFEIENNTCSLYKKEQRFVISPFDASVNTDRDITSQSKTEYNEKVSITSEKLFAVIIITAYWDDNDDNMLGPDTKVILAEKV